MPVDRRGTWAMGAVGASMMWGHGSSDDHGPNAPNPEGDDLIECGEIITYISDIELGNLQMGCWPGVAPANKPRREACTPAA